MASQCSRLGILESAPTFWRSTSPVFAGQGAQRAGFRALALVRRERARVGDLFYYHDLPEHCQMRSLVSNSDVCAYLCSMLRAIRIIRLSNVEA